MGAGTSQDRVKYALWWKLPSEFYTLVDELHGDLSRLTVCEWADFARQVWVGTIVDKKYNQSSNGGSSPPTYLFWLTHKFDYLRVRFGIPVSALEEPSVLAAVCGSEVPYHIGNTIMTYFRSIGVCCGHVYGGNTDPVFMVPSSTLNALEVRKWCSGIIRGGHSRSVVELIDRNTDDDQTRAQIVRKVLEEAASCNSFAAMVLVEHYGLSREQVEGLHYEPIVNPQHWRDFNRWLDRHFAREVPFRDVAVGASHVDVAKED